LQREPTLTGGLQIVKIISRTALSALAAATVALGACSSVKVHTDWNTTLDFTRYRTFAWLPDTVDKQLSPFAQQRLKTAITEALVKDGLSEAMSDPELYVTFRAKASSRTEYTTVSNGYGYGPGWGEWGYYGGVGVSSTTAQQIPVGNLVVVLVDPKLNQMVWRGSASADLSNDPRERAEQLKEAMDKMFAGFPPRNERRPY
jgi:hypothetical protein